MNGIYWIEDDRHWRLAIASRPRPDDWLRNDLASLRAGGVDVLVSLITPEEADELGLSQESELAEQYGMTFLSYPIPDRHTPPDPAGFRRFVSDLADMVRAGKNVAAHCRGCIGRSTVLIASVMITLGAQPEEALALIERSRGCMVPDTPEQREWILSFQP